MLVQHAALAITQRFGANASRCLSSMRPTSIGFQYTPNRADGCDLSRRLYPSGGWQSLHGWGESGDFLATYACLLAVHGMSLTHGIITASSLQRVACQPATNKSWDEDGHANRVNGVTIIVALQTSPNAARAALRVCVLASRVGTAVGSAHVPTEV